MKLKVKIIINFYIGMFKRLILTFFSTQELCEELTKRPHLVNPIKIGRIYFTKLTDNIYLREWQKKD